MSISNILVNDIVSPYKDLFCNTITCQNIVQNEGSAPINAWPAVVSNTVNLAGVPNVAYARWSHLGNTVTANINVSGLTVNAIDSLTSFIFTLPKNPYHVSNEVILIGTARVFGFPEINCTVVNSGLTPDRCTVNLKSNNLMLATAVDFLIELNYLVN